MLAFLPTSPTSLTIAVSPPAAVHAPSPWVPPATSTRAMPVAAARSRECWGRGEAVGGK